MRRRHARQIRRGIMVARKVRWLFARGNEYTALNIYEDVRLSLHTPTLTRRAYDRTYDRAERRNIFGTR